MLSWPSKDPDEVLDYQIDWTNRLGTNETIATSTWTVAEGSVVIGSTTVTSNTTIVWLSGGAINEKCELLNRITTSDGRTYDMTVTLRIRSH